jgi:hypothetical protein
MSGTDQQAQAAEASNDKQDDAVEVASFRDASGASA